MSSASVGPLCFIKSKVNAEIYQDILDYFMLPSAADFPFAETATKLPDQSLFWLILGNTLMMRDTRFLIFISCHKHQN